MDDVKGAGASPSPRFTCDRCGRLAPSVVRRRIRLTLSKGNDRTWHVCDGCLSDFLGVLNGYAVKALRRPG